MGREATRRQALGLLGAAVVGAAARAAGAERKGKAGAEDVVPGEDLMREHGVLRRVMFLYDDAAHRLDGTTDVRLDVVVAAAGIVRRVIEDYHEKLEERFLFPRFEKAARLVELVTVLRAQHLAGRRVTDELVRLAAAPARAEADRRRLAQLLRGFNRMYRPHAAREDTVLFPAFHALVGGKAYAELGEQFEDQEKSALGDGGFERAVADVAKLEAEAGIGDLAAFTP